MAKKKAAKRTRRAQLVADSFSVCCPECGEPQPNYMGSEMWHAMRRCSCFLIRKRRSSTPGRRADD